MSARCGAKSAATGLPPYAASVALRELHDGDWRAIMHFVGPQKLIDALKFLCCACDPLVSGIATVAANCGTHVVDILFHLFEAQDDHEYTKLRGFAPRLALVMDELDRRLHCGSDAQAPEPESGARSMQTDASSNGDQSSSCVPIARNRLYPADIRLCDLETDDSHAIIRFVGTNAFRGALHRSCPELASCWGDIGLLASQCDGRVSHVLFEAWKATKNFSLLGDDLLKIVPAMRLVIEGVFLLRDEAFDAEHKPSEPPTTAFVLCPPAPYPADTTLYQLESADRSMLIDLADAGEFTLAMRRVCEGHKDLEVRDVQQEAAGCTALVSSILLSALSQPDPQHSLDKCALIREAMPHLVLVLDVIEPQYRFSIPDRTRPYPSYVELAQVDEADRHAMIECVGRRAFAEGMSEQHNQPSYVSELYVHEKARECHKKTGDVLRSAVDEEDGIYSISLSRCAAVRKAVPRLSLVLDDVEALFRAHERDQEQEPIPNGEPYPVCTKIDYLDSHSTLDLVSVVGGQTRYETFLVKLRPQYAPGATVGDVYVHDLLVYAASGIHDCERRYREMVIHSPRLSDIVERVIKTLAARDPAQESARPPLVDQSNFFSVLLGLLMDDDEPVFPQPAQVLVCDKCRNGPVPEHCKHNLHLPPDWKYVPVTWEAASDLPLTFSTGTYADTVTLDELRSPDLERILHAFEGKPRALLRPVLETGTLSPRVMEEWYHGTVDANEMRLIQVLLGTSLNKDQLKPTLAQHYRAWELLRLMHEAQVGEELRQVGAFRGLFARVDEWAEQQARTMLRHTHLFLVGSHAYHRKPRTPFVDQCLPPSPSFGWKTVLDECAALSIERILSSPWRPLLRAQGLASAPRRVRASPFSVVASSLGFASEAHWLMGVAQDVHSPFNIAISNRLWAMVDPFMSIGSIMASVTDTEMSPSERTPSHLQRYYADQRMCDLDPEHRFLVECEIRQGAHKIRAALMHGVQPKTRALLEQSIPEREQELDEDAHNLVQVLSHPSCTIQLGQIIHAVKSVNQSRRAFAGVPGFAGMC